MIATDLVFALARMLYELCAIDRQKMDFSYLSIARCTANGERAWRVTECSAWAVCLNKHVKFTFGITFIEGIF